MFAEFYLVYVVVAGSDGGECVSEEGLQGEVDVWSGRLLPR